MVKRARKKKPRIKLWIALIVAVMASALLLIQYFVQLAEIEEAKKARYAAFGIEMPEGYSIHGIDVSYYQDIIDWPSVAAMQVDSIKLGFAFMKATEGMDLKDMKFKRNWNRSKEAGIVRGAYHFFIADESGSKQAKFYMKNAPLERGDLPPVIDIESLHGASKAKMQKELRACLNELEAYYHVKPVIYTYLHFYENYLAKEFDEYPLWIAHYLQPEKPRIERSWTFWQHSERGRANGITSRVDFNIFYGDSLSFRNLLLK